MASTSTPCSRLSLLWRLYQRSGRLLSILWDALTLLIHDAEIVLRGRQSLVGGCAYQTIAC